MATKTFLGTWMGQWRQSTGTYYASGTPIRTGGTPGYVSFVGFDMTAIRDAVNSSYTDVEVYLNLNVTNEGSFQLGMHKEASNKGTDGIPYYRYAGKDWFLSIGARRMNIADISLINQAGVRIDGFKNIINDGYLGPVLYGAVNSDQGVADGITGTSTNVSIEIVGTWNSPPTIPGITAPTQGQIVNGSFELKGTASTDVESPSSQLQYEWQVNDGTGWKSVGLGTKGVVNKVVDFSTYNAISNAQVRLRAFDGEYYSDWKYSSYFTISHNKAPGVPTAIAPGGGNMYDRAQPITFHWTHNDSNSQSAFELEWRLQGETVWNTTGKITSSASEHLFGGNSFPKGTMEWRIKTYDIENLESPWSTPTVFVSTDKSETPVITHPTMDEDIPISRINVTWTATEQYQYEIYLYVADPLGGWVEWSDEQISSDQVIEIPVDLTNLTTYEIGLRVKAVDEIYSDYATVTFHVNFTPPNQPILTSEAIPSRGAVQITIQNNVTDTPGQPLVSHNDLLRRVVGVSNSLEKIANDLPPNATFTDYSIASGVTYEYYVTAYGENETNIESESLQVTVNFVETILSVARNPNNFVGLSLNPSRSVTYGNNRTLTHFNGRPFPVAEFGKGQTLDLNVSFTITDQETLDKLIEIVNLQQTLLYRDTRGRKEYVTIEAIEVTDRQPTGYTVSFTLNKVDYSEVT